MELPSFISLKDQAFVYNGDGTFVFYVPEKFFSTKLAVLSGEYASIFGILNYTILDKNGKATFGLHEFNLPSTFVSKPDDIEIAKNIQLTKNTKPQDYRLLKYNKGGLIITNYEISVSVDNLNKLYKALQYGNIPNTVPYNKLQDYFIRNIILSDNMYSVSLQLIGVVFSELCRDKDDATKLFRLTGSNDMTAYQMINIREAPRDVSPFTALTSETWDEAVLNSIVTDNNKESPLEKIMMD